MTGILLRLKKKFEKNPQLESEYNQVFEDYEKKGVTEGVPQDEENDNPVYYLPNLLEILIRFRRYRIALNADISKAFLQIMLNERDMDVHRFLWYKGDTIKKMRFKRVTFGINSSPFLLNATIKHHLNISPPSKAVDELKENLYMDDLLSGEDDTKEALSLHKDAKEVMAKAGMKLTKWNTNDKEIISKEHLPECDPDSVKVLGAKWSPEADEYRFDGIALPSNVLLTKRVILSCLARIFDPLGFVSPVVMSGKILFQNLWKLGIDWDEEVPETIREQLEDWVEDLQILKKWRQNRTFFTEDTKWEEVKDNVTFHAFADASEKGYGGSSNLHINTSRGKTPN